MGSYPTLPPLAASRPTQARRRKRQNGDHLALSNCFRRTFLNSTIIGLPAKFDVLSVMIYRLLYVASPPGLGEAVVSGQVEPDTYVVDPVLGDMNYEHEFANENYVELGGGIKFPTKWHHHAGWDDNYLVHLLLNSTAI